MFMPTEFLSLTRDARGYWGVSWYDAAGKRHHRTFGRRERPARTRFSKFYAQWRRDWHTRNPDDEGPITVRRGWELFAKHAARHYRHGDGTPTGEALNFQHAVRELLALFGDLRADRFGPKGLRQVQAAMIQAYLSVNTINARIRKIRHLFRWLVVEELIPANVWHGLQSVPALQPGRTKARVNVPVKPVPEAHVFAVANHSETPATLAAMIRIQFLTGMRPAEVCRMRPIDVETSAKVWQYRPTTHKSAHRQRERVVMLGPRAQAELKPFLSRDLEAFCFSPAEAVGQRHASKRTHRHQPNPDPQTTRRVGECYRPAAYARAIKYRCQDLDIPHWSPNQLRHNAATRIRQAFGLDVAQVVLGHARADITQIYAARDLDRAVAAMERVG